jgi:hypothetical protein
LAIFFRRSLAAQRHIKLPEHRRDRSAKLMRGVAGEPPLTLKRFFEPA